MPKNRKLIPCSCMARHNCSPFLTVISPLFSFSQNCGIISFFSLWYSPRMSFSSFSFSMPGICRDRKWLAKLGNTAMYLLGTWWKRRCSRRWDFVSKVQDASSCRGPCPWVPACGPWWHYHIWVVGRTPTQFCSKQASLASVMKVPLVSLKTDVIFAKIYLNSLGTAKMEPKVKNSSTNSVSRYSSLVSW